jgi:hypothetical protein
MKFTKTDNTRAVRAAIYVSIPGEGTIERGFRNKGEAINYLQRNYGVDWKKLRPRFNHDVSGFSEEMRPRRLKWED